jgi:hypothetical protein
MVAREFSEAVQSGGFAALIRGTEIDLDIPQQ